MYSRRYERLILLLTFSVCVAVTGQLSAAVVDVRIDVREPFAEGHTFGRSGPYERIAGRMLIAVDPEAAVNARVTDIKLAPRTSNGMVQFWTDFFLLKPVNPELGNQRLIFDVSNRGNKVLMNSFNGAGGNDPNTLANAGNGFLMRQGYTVVWIAWNGDAIPGNNRMQIDLPIATNNGEPITSKIYAEITVNEKSFSEPFYWGNSNPYPTVDLDNRTATLAIRPNRREPAVDVPHEQWAFARVENEEVISDAKHLYVKAGFQPGMIYELLYTGKDPRVMGLGFVAVRDGVSYLRYPRAAESRLNIGSIEKAYIFGVSQSGRFIHHYLYDGFNGDDQGRIVFDGAMPHVGGGGKGLFNYRFGQTTRHGSQHEDNWYPSDFFPLNTVPQHDPVTGRSGDTFARSRANGLLPRIFFTGTSTEYWTRATSLLHTDVTGTTDADVDPNVRIYFITGAQHGNSSSSNRGMFQHQRNTLDHRPVLRALLVALDRWVSEDEEPPPSSYPRIDDGTLVDLETWRKAFPPIPGSTKAAHVYTPLRLNYGPRWESEGIADIIPPEVGEPFRTLVPAVDDEGIELAGIKLPAVSVPLATYSGWNVRGASSGAEGMLGRWAGSQWPLARSAAERQATNDPRRSILERYPTHAQYIGRVAQAALQLHKQRLLLEEDVVRIVDESADTNYWSSQPPSKKD